MLRVYWELMCCGFRRSAAYRSAAISGAITNTFFGFLRASVFVGLYEGREQVAGYSLADALIFTFATQGMLALIEMWTWWRIAETVQTGQVATDLLRPVDYQLAWLAQDYGRAAFQLIARSLIPLTVGMAAFGLVLPADPLIWLALLPSLVLAVTVSFGWRFILNLSSFWVLDHRGAAGIANLVVTLLSGFLVPLTMFPDAVRTAVYALPFSAMVAIPIDILLGKHVGADLAGVLLLQAFWAVAMLWAGRVVLGAAVRKLVIQGG